METSRLFSRQKIQFFCLNLGSSFRFEKPLNVAECPCGRVSMWPSVCFHKACGRVSMWPSVHVAKCPCGRVSVFIRHVAKCPCGRVTVWPSVCVAECLCGRTSVWPNVMWPSGMWPSVMWPSVCEPILNVLLDTLNQSAMARQSTVSFELCSL